MGLSIEKIGQVSIPVQNIDRAVVFYRDVLGLQFIWQTGNLAFFQSGETRILLDVPESTEFAHKSSVLYFQVPDIHEAHNELARQGVQLRGKPHEIGKLGDVSVWMQFFEDTEGNVMAVQSEVNVGV